MATLPLEELETARKSQKLYFKTLENHGGKETRWTPISEKQDSVLGKTDGSSHFYLAKALVNPGGCH